MRTILSILSVAIVTAMMLSVPSVAQAQYRSIAASDQGLPVFTGGGSTELGAEDSARSSCYRSLGEACKAIASYRGSYFSVVQCGGTYVHMSSGGSARESLNGAYEMARRFGHGGCNLIWQRYL